MADNGTLGRILTMTVNGPSERMKGLSDEVAALLKKPKGQITQQEVNDLLGKIDKMRNASPPLNNTEALNRLSFSKSVADRAVNEGLMTPGQYMNRKDALQIGVAGMYGGGSTKMPSGGATGPVLARTGAATGQRPLPAGGVVVVSRPRYGPFHRKPRDQNETANVEKSGELWGGKTRNYMSGLDPKVKAYDGPLPPGAKGYEFYTDIKPDIGHVPGQPTWTGGTPGVRLDGDWAKMPIEIVRIVK